MRDAGFVTKNAAFGMTILVGASKTLFTILAALYVDQMGRRPLLFISIGGLFVFLIVMGLAFERESLAWLMVVGTTEVFSTRIRAKAMSLATSSNRLIAGIVASTTLPLVQALTPMGFFFFYACMTMGTGAYVTGGCPEK
ncbi:hypothetical protein NGA_0248520 [Nannochloropsis gaditana CCMP526]|uniref:uncharacterized protein n=1 Tax=Nannochloropsis gaditana (strain CCMP526) TaxID=1093141 RepID=UPI00029F53A7|nr:hypothetical protein NGA_0248520 [Nannochloropsis gaditana CCMP526]EKU22007.1 hypothetical protein NGA_0248520 [Nannochloropsis gaditana CCMP526]|eukprot:XP_005854354.1 hypothetical protein NGA_0248520 [Nannochloropsis gaditana CCMP526]